MSTVVAPAEVFAFCRGEHENPQPPPPYQDTTWEGYCLRFTRLAFQEPPASVSAAAAWVATNHRHHVTLGNQVPRGVPVFWLGGSRGFGHIAVSAGGGLCWSTDWGGAGEVNLARIDDITRQWNLDLVGWSEDLSGARVWVPPTAAKTPRMDEIVELARTARRLTGNPAKDQALAQIIELAKPWSAAY